MPHFCVQLFLVYFRMIIKNSTPQIKSTYNITCKCLYFSVGMTGFEPATTRPPEAYFCFISLCSFNIYYLHNNQRVKIHTLLYLVGFFMQRLCNGREKCNGNATLFLCIYNKRLWLKRRFGTTN